MSDDKSIEKYKSISKVNFSEDRFLKDILEYSYEEKLLDDKFLKKLSYERVEVLRTQLKYYTKDESSSVMVELAENILQSIDYTIGIYLKSLENIDMIIEGLKTRSLFDMFKDGHDLIKKKILDSKKLLEGIQENKLNVNNYSYNDTIDYGILLFFKEYDDFFSAHETPGSIDYQLCIDNMNYTGVEYIYNYLEILTIENKFCQNFYATEIKELLNGYDKENEVLLINIFELVLINSLGSMICGKSSTNLNINSIDRQQIKNNLRKLSLEELQGELLNYSKICCEILEVKNKTLVDYINKATMKITSLIYESIKLNKLETVFLSFNENKNNEIIEYIDKEKLSNSVFRKLTEKIRECSTIEEKIILIQNNINSLEDLRDMLDAECLFEDEYNKYFRNLSKMEIILLSKYLSDLSLEKEEEKDWHNQLNKVISNLSEEEKADIRVIKERIQLSY
ncbi:DUF6179 domain-containing protein [Clostridium uliginosum]|uniref:Uncharacterized protein n=1 Tax=Clostridium uliginosum TaxID=119641 RepID=A0A1I1JHK7_9CLOT|nr:DUF6179 domain-containing protein [Clostridium uliginosum]SFC47956.1 hypothetical protein SAMN05421842_10434 [Clostridium uliginosum]